MLNSNVETFDLSCYTRFNLQPSHDIPISSMLWCDRLYSQKGKKLIVRTCYYLSFILKYKNSNSQYNNVTSGGRFCKLIFNSYQKFLCSKPDALLFCVLDLCRRQTAYHIPEMTDIAHVWHCEASINVKKSKCDGVIHVNFCWKSAGSIISGHLYPMTIYIRCQC